MNSQIELSESTTLASKLIERTQEKKLKWQIADPSLGSAGHPKTSDEPVELNRFSAQLLDPGQQAVIGQREDGFLQFSLIEHDPRWSSQDFLTAVVGFEPPLAPDKTVLEVSIETNPSYGFDTKQEKYLASLLVDLYGLARRSALRIDANVERALSYLDRLAG